MSVRYVQVQLKSHKDKVCSLYKRALRNEWSKHDEPADYRYHAVLMRKRFEDHRNEKDMRIAKKLLEDGELELEKDMHYEPRKFAFSPGGINYQRQAPTPDWVLDFWHPLEKAQYPEYFARREQRKKEYIENWEKKYGKPMDNADHH